jgi:deoxyribodipyrimidine photo-lyase
MAPAVLWFRRDLRLDDLPALRAAAEAGPDGVVPLFVADPALLGPSGPNRRRFLAAALAALNAELGGALVVRGGDPARVIPAVAAEAGATVVAATADFGPYGTTRDAVVRLALSADGRRLTTVDSNYAVAPGQVRSVAGTPVKVFTAYRRAWQAIGWPGPSPTPAVRYRRLSDGEGGPDLESGLAIPGSHGLPDWWEGLPLGPAQMLPDAGPAAARVRLERFVAGPLNDYHRDRDLPAVAGTSGLSPYLRFGCLHPRSALALLGTDPGAERLRTELAWRDFYADVLWHRPDSARRPLLGFGARLRWDTDERARDRFAAWATGTTGYPLVDAGMRQLLSQGWMHNRARMVTASFLVKDLHIDWRLGARWFMWHLVDGDLASNQHGWQWVAGIGTDAAPFHRVLNPWRQQERFDPTGAYVSATWMSWRRAITPPGMPIPARWWTTSWSAARRWPASPRRDTPARSGRLRAEGARSLARSEFARGLHPGVCGGIGPREIRLATQRTRGTDAFPEQRSTSVSMRPRAACNRKPPRAGDRGTRRPTIGRGSRRTGSIYELNRSLTWASGTMPVAMLASEGLSAMRASACSCATARYSASSIELHPCSNASLHAVRRETRSPNNRIFVSVIRSCSVKASGSESSPIWTR